MKELIEKTFKNYNILLTKDQIDKFYIYFSFLIEENEKYNLTAIINPQEVIVKHFVDSVLPYKSIKKNSLVVDVGTGAGFPGIPLKIIREDINLTLVDSLQKRINFLNQLIEKLNLNNVKTFHARVEDFCKTNREKFDYVISRAVAPLPTLSEYMIPLTKIGGICLIYKSEKLDEELKISKHAITILGGKVEKIENFTLFEYKSTRKILFLRKLTHSNEKFPRQKNLPKLKPIL